MFVVQTTAVQFNPLTDGTKLCFLTQSLQWWYIPILMLVVLTPSTSPQVFGSGTIWSIKN